MDRVKPLWKKYWPVIAGAFLVYLLLTALIYFASGHSQNEPFFYQVF